MVQPVREIEKLISDWNETQRAIKRLKCDIENTKIKSQDLADKISASITPDDSKEGEIFNIWYRDGILQVKIISGSRTLSWRKYPSDL